MIKKKAIKKIRAKIGNQTKLNKKNLVRKYKLTWVNFIAPHLG